MANIYKNAQFDLTTTDVTDIYQAPSNSRAIIQIYMQQILDQVTLKLKLSYMIIQQQLRFNLQSILLILVIHSQYLMDQSY